MANETLVSLPPQFDSLGQVRTFLIRLVEKVDIILGYRGDEPYITSKDATNIVDSTNRGVRFPEIQESINDLNDKVNGLLTDTSVSVHQDSVLTVSPSYTQAEVEAIRDEIFAVNATLTEVIQTLKQSGIIL